MLKSQFDVRRFAASHWALNVAHFRPGSARALACSFRRLAEMLLIWFRESRWRGANDGTPGACAPQEKTRRRVIREGDMPGGW
jgi:hypothetical protein